MTQLSVNDKVWINPKVSRYDTDLYIGHEGTIHGIDGDTYLVVFNEGIGGVMIQCSESELLINPETIPKPLSRKALYSRWHRRNQKRKHEENKHKARLWDERNQRPGDGMMGG